MAEGDGLLNRCRGNSTKGSNPFFSAIFKQTKRNKTMDIQSKWEQRKSLFNPASDRLGEMGATQITLPIIISSIIEDLGSMAKEISGQRKNKVLQIRDSIKDMTTDMLATREKVGTCRFESYHPLHI